MRKGANEFGLLVSSGPLNLFTGGVPGAAVNVGSPRVLFCATDTSQRVSPQLLLSNANDTHHAAVFVLQDVTVIEECPDDLRPTEIDA